MASISLNNVSKSYGDKCVVNNITALIEDGDFVVIVGKSGSGKTTLLRLIAGLERGEGKIFFDDTDVTEMPAGKRNIAYATQRLSLFDDKTVAQNIGYPLRIRGWDKTEIRKRVAHVAMQIGLADRLDSFPCELSGGECQRVALARCVIGEPEIYLFDEPLSSLDISLRGEMRKLISSLHTELKKTFVYVTHDFAEAMILADKVIVLDQGKIIAYGQPKQLYNEPCNVSTARFFGDVAMNMMVLPKFGEDKLVGVRAEDVLLGGGEYEGVVEFVEELGYSCLLYIVADIGKLVARTSDRSYHIGDHISFSLNRIKLFDKHTGERQWTEES